MFIPLLLSAAAAAPVSAAQAAPVQSAVPAQSANTVVAPPALSPQGTPLPTGGTVASAVGGSNVAIGVSALRLMNSPQSGVYEFVLNETGTTWQEPFLLGVPPVPAGPDAPLLVVFHGWGNTHNSILTQTSYFHEARQRGWYIVAPLGAHKYNYAIPYAQQNVQAVLDWVTEFLPVDESRIYGVGFSMGGGNVTNYAARHLDPDHARFAAIVNHTGTVSIRDVFYNAVDTSLLEHVDMFGGTPTQLPFEYARSSVIDIEPNFPAPDQQADLARNLVGLPMFTFAAKSDPLQHLVRETRIFTRWMWRLGGTPRMKLENGALHSWDTLDEWSACQFLSQHTLDDSPQGTHSLLADRDAGYYCFQVEQDAPNAFTPFRWNLDESLNRLVLDQTENLARLTVDTAAAGLDTGVAVKVILGTADGLPEEVVLDGYATPPTDVLRNGVSAPLGSWSYDALSGTVSIIETNAAAYPLWRIEP
jgi:pimeloyl-ACP methyl ester carboxylesterase